MLYNEQKPSNVCGYLAKINNTLQRCYSVQEYEKIQLEQKEKYIIQEEQCNNNFYCYWSWKILIVLICISIFCFIFLDDEDRSLKIKFLFILLTSIMIFIYQYFYN